MTRRVSGILSRPFIASTEGALAQAFFAFQNDGGHAIPHSNELRFVIDFAPEEIRDSREVNRVPGRETNETVGLVG